MRWGVAVWVLLYVGCATLVWSVAGFFAMLTFVGGLGCAILAIAVAEWLTRERTPKRRIRDEEGDE